MISAAGPASALLHCTVPLNWECLAGMTRGACNAHAGPFTIFNEPDERATLRRWFDHMRQVRRCASDHGSYPAIMSVEQPPRAAFLQTRAQVVKLARPLRATSYQQVKPGIYVTYNGDYFDWPFIETRAAQHGMDMFQEIGFRMDKPGGNCLSQCAFVDSQPTSNKLAAMTAPPLPRILSAFSIDSNCLSQCRPGTRSDPYHALLCHHASCTARWGLHGVAALKAGIVMSSVRYHVPNYVMLCRRRFAVHMDCLAWVNRDSYLPQGSRGLKVRAGTPNALDANLCGSCIIGSFDYCWKTYITSGDAIIQRMFTLAGWGCQQARSTPQNTPGRPLDTSKVASRDSCEAGGPGGHAALPEKTTKHESPQQRLCFYVYLCRR